MPFIHSSHSPQVASSCSCRNQHVNLAQRGALNARSSAAPRLPGRRHLINAGVCRAGAADNSNGFNATMSMTDAAMGDDFCVIESCDSVKDFEDLELNEIRDNIQARRNKIFLLMEEVRRLRIQQRLKTTAADQGSGKQQQEAIEEKFTSALPFLPLLSEKVLTSYYAAYAAAALAAVVFGGLVAPALELKLGLGGSTYTDLVTALHLPQQLAHVDPIVASFCGGSVGVMSGLLLVEMNNIKRQKKDRCLYCSGTGYLTCGNCVGSGVDPSATTSATATGNGKGGISNACVYCSGTGKVMCTGCLCTGKHLATEHDPRIDPFD